jgi:hypothetical protein
VTIQEGPLTQAPVPGFLMLRQQVTLIAPPASVDIPLSIIFLLDASLIPAGVNPATIAVFKDGVLVGDCDGSGRAIPDPCVAARAPAAGGDIAIGVLTSSSSTWFFGVSLRTPTATPTATGCDPLAARNTGRLVARNVEPGLAMFENDTETCVFDVGVAIYDTSDGLFQQRFLAATTAAIGPGRHPLRVATPACGALQQDAFFGEPIREGGFPDYRGRFLAGRLYPDGGCPPTPTPGPAAT